MLEIRGGRAAELGIREATGSTGRAAELSRSLAGSARLAAQARSPWVSGRKHSPGGTARRVGTALFTRRFGNEVGRDEAGNVYYQDKKRPGRRWVIYNGNNDGSRVPPGWQLWLRGTIDELPDKALPPVRKFQQKPTAQPDRHDGGVPPRRSARQRQDAARLDRRLRALDPRISVRSARRIAADRARARGVRPRRAAAECAGQPAAEQGRRRRRQPGRRHADGAARRGARHPQQAQRHRPERRASARASRRGGRT